MENHSAIKKKNNIMPFSATWIDVEIFILSEISQTEKDKYPMIPFIYGNNLFRKGTNEPIYKTEMES